MVNLHRRRTVVAEYQRRAEFGETPDEHHDTAAEQPRTDERQHDAAETRPRPSAHQLRGL